MSQTNVTEAIMGPGLSLGKCLCPGLGIYEDIRLVVAREHVRVKLTRRRGLHGEIGELESPPWACQCEYLDPAVPEDDQWKTFLLLKVITSLR